MTMYTGIHVDSLLFTKNTETITNNLKCDDTKKTVTRTKIVTRNFTCSA